MNRSNPSWMLVLIPLRRRLGKLQAPTETLDKLQYMHSSAQIPADIAAALPNLASIVPKATGLSLDRLRLKLSPQLPRSTTSRRPLRPLVPRWPMTPNTSRRKKPVLCVVPKPGPTDTPRRVALLLRLSTRLLRTRARPNRRDGNLATFVLAGR